jgi:hypothetical protein
MAERETLINSHVECIMHAHAASTLQYIIYRCKSGAVNDRRIAHLDALLVKRALDRLINRGACSMDGATELCKATKPRKRKSGIGSNKGFLSTG